MRFLKGAKQRVGRKKGPGGVKKKKNAAGCRKADWVDGDPVKHPITRHLDQNGMSCMSELPDIGRDVPRLE